MNKEHFKLRIPKTPGWYYVLLNTSLSTINSALRYQEYIMLLDKHTGHWFIDGDEFTPKEMEEKFSNGERRFLVGPRVPSVEEHIKLKQSHAQQNSR